MLTPDHLTVTAQTLDEGVAAVEACLGVPLAAGGRHAAMGTHNRLLKLGPGLYLEVIAIDPEAEPPAHARWFDLDSVRGPARLSNWAARSDDLDGDLARAPEGAGEPMALERGELRWRMAVPRDGRLPFGGAYPALLAWDCDVHPADLLPDSGCRLRRLELEHPAPNELRQALAGIADDEHIAISAGPAPALHAIIETPAGPRELT